MAYINFSNDSAKAFAKEITLKALETGYVKHGKSSEETTNNAMDFLQTVLQRLTSDALDDIKPNRD